MSVYQNDIKRLFKHLLLKYETQIALDKTSNRLLERFSIMELTLIEYVLNNDSVTQNDLLRILPIKRGKLLGVIKKMIDTDILRKNVNEKDKRSSYITLGSKGQKIMNDYLLHEEDFIEFVLKDMTINEEKAIVKFLSKINQTDYMK